MELLHATDVRLGLVTNGEHWMLVDAPRGDTTGFASWYAWLWIEQSDKEFSYFRSFRSLLSVRRLFAALVGETLEDMLADSAKNQQEVTDRLGLQVRNAVEILIQSLDRADQDELAVGPAQHHPRSGANGHDAAHIPLFRRGAKAAVVGRSSVRSALCRLDPRGAASRSG